MATWLTGSYVTTYNAVAGKNTAQTLLTSAGTVDTNSVTRLQYPTDSVVTRDRVNAAARFSFVKTDFGPAGDKTIVLAMYIARADQFAPGVVPTQAQILALGSALQVYRSTLVGLTVAEWDPDTVAWGLTANGPRQSSLSANTKYWVLVAPAILTGYPGAANTTNTVPISGSIGRAVSFWTNRTPNAPVITSPVSGAVVAPGGNFNLTFDPADPDEIFGGTSYFYTDVAGVQVQYAARPTASNPTPAWADLPIANNAGDALGPGWAIRSSTALPGTSGSFLLLNNMTIPVRVGSNTIVANQGSLPSGDWQIRLRTFDYGHSEPSTMRPLGMNRTAASLTPDSYPAVNTSVWSDPVVVSVPTQVPPPTLVSPINSNALPEGVPVTLKWKYRNTALPPFAQAGRIIQIREADDVNWTTIATGASGSSEFLLSNDPGSIEYLEDGDFENRSTDGWYIPKVGPEDYELEVTNVGGVTHSGERALEVTYVGAIPPPAITPASPLTKVVDLRPGDDFFRFMGYVYTTNPVSFRTTIKWLNASNAVVGTPSTNVSPLSGWDLMLGNFTRPATAVKARIEITNNASDNPLRNRRFDDFSFVGSPTALAPYKLSATTEYVWRVQVSDTDGKISNFSEPGRFWIVPGPSSGPVRPIPTETTEGATLGCGTHRIEIFRRGGKNRVGEITNITHVDYARVRDDISTAKIVVSDWGVDCGKLLASLRTWAYEVVIFRDNGYSVDRVWEGPITLLTHKTNQVIIDAKDVMVYPYRRIIKQAMNDSVTGPTVVDRATRVLQNTLAQDDPNILAYLQVLSREDDATQYRSTPAYGRTAFEEVDDMASNAGLDYTAVGRSILIWGTKNLIGMLPEFKDDNFSEPPIVSEYGMSMANRYAVTDGSGVFGEATRLDADGNDPDNGLVEMLSSSWASDSTEDSGTYTQAGLAKLIESFEGYAERSIANRYPAPVVVRIPDNTSLTPDTLVSIQQLVPGVGVPLHSTSTLREVWQIQKLDSVKVVEEKGQETISITLSQFNGDDANPGEVAE